MSSNYGRGKFSIGSELKKGIKQKAGKMRENEDFWPATSSGPSKRESLGNY